MVAYQIILIRLRKGNLKRETEYILIAAPNNYFKAKIDNTLKYKLCGDGDETVTHEIECSRLVEKEIKSRYEEER